MTLLQSFDERQTHREGKKQRERGKLLAEYREIFGREDSPKPGDADRLCELVQELHLSRERVARDAAAVRDFNATRRMVESIPQLEKAVADARAKASEYNAAMKELNKRFGPVGQNLLDTERALGNARAQDRTIRDMHRRHPELLGLGKE